MSVHKKNKVLPTLETVETEEDAPFNPKLENFDEKKLISILKFFKFASKSDKLYILIGSLSACGNGILIPIYSILVGRMTNNLSPKNSMDEIMTTVGDYALIFLYVGLLSFLCSLVMMASWIIIGQSTGSKIKEQYSKALLRQEIEWFDRSNPNELITQISEDCACIQEAVGEKIGSFIMTISTFLTGIIIGFIEGWQISLILLAGIPFLVASSIFSLVIIQRSRKVEESAYNIAGGRASQAFSSVKTVKALIGEAQESKEYENLITVVKSKLIKFGLLVAISTGFLYFCLNSTYALGFYSSSYAIADHWYNSVKDQDWDIGTALSSFYAILYASFSLGQSLPPLSAFAKGRICGTKIFQLIDRIPKIVIDEPDKIEAKNLKGEIVFKDVDFFYPLRPDVKILNKINLTITEGMKVAFTGESGCGKSTIFQLLERFYDPCNGEILVDGINIKDYNLRTLRYQYGYAGQEPILFEGTIRENLIYGKHDATEEEIINALKDANAWDFVLRLKKKLRTKVGISGSQFSGGQKQRIAIARALIKLPKILLLDEATSALDRTNELAIQKTLDEISKGRTTLVIAHRLTTIQDADLICFFHEGRIAEQGTHDELISLKLIILY